MTNSQLAELAAQDCARIRTHIYSLAGRTADIDDPPPNGLEGVRIRDWGAKIFMNGGYEQFLASYYCALDALYNSHIVRHLREGGWLEIEFHFGYDSADNWNGDWGWFKWQIIRVYKIT